MLSVAAILFAAPPIAVAPLRLEHGSWFVELRADGTIVNRAGAEVGRIDGGEVQLNGRSLFYVDDAGAVLSEYFGHSDRRFDDDDALTYVADGERWRARITDDGELVIDQPSGDAHAMGVRVSGVTQASRRAAVLLALSLLTIERVRPLPAPWRVSFTLDGFAAMGGYFEIASEMRIDWRFSFALHVGGGSRWNLVTRTATTLAWEIGVDPRWYFFRDSGYLAWSTHFARARTGFIGFQTLETPPGLSTGLLAGYKFDFPFVTVDMSVGALFPLVVPSREPSHPPAAFVARFGVGFSF